MKKGWLYILSPCIIAAMLAIVGIISGMLQIRVTGGWSMLAVIIGFPFLLAMIIADILLKWRIKHDILLLWVVEITVVVIGLVILNCYIF